jgi:uncharacterized protein
MMNLPTKRIEFIDALRGFSIFTFIIMHNIQHYSYHVSPSFFPNWLKKLDEIFYQTFYFLLGGKTYCIFALLFGFSFYIQLSNSYKKNIDFRFRFAWRMFLLFLFSMFNTLFFLGDILSMYAILGVFLIFTYHWSDYLKIVIAFVLIFQPILWINFFLEFIEHGKLLYTFSSTTYIKPILTFLDGDSFIDHCVGNIQYGKKFNLLWSFENGRFFQTFGLFLIGSVFAKNNFFEMNTKNYSFWLKVLKSISIIFIVLYIFDKHILNLFLDNFEKTKMRIILESYSNILVASILTSVIFILYYKKIINKFFDNFINIGKMSLTIYILNSILGAITYYNYGFGLFHYTGGFFCFLIGILLFIIQVKFSNYWFKTNKQGPLETLLSKGTLIKF